MFHIDAADYMMSICGDDSLKELSSPGKSGSIFYLSQDERFVIKTLRKAELKVSPQRLFMNVCFTCSYYVGELYIYSQEKFVAHKIYDPNIG